MSRSRAKQLAAECAAVILEGHLDRVERLGFGTGSTVRLVLEILLSSPSARRKLASKRIAVSSLDTLLYLYEWGVQASESVPPEGLEVYIDGADEFSLDPQGTCMLVKGRGGAMVREKLLAASSSKVFIVVDESKESRKLGEKGKPVPIEVMNVVLAPLVAKLRGLGVKVEIRSCSCKDGPTISDNGNPIVDAWPWGVMDSEDFAELLDSIPGVVGHGLFLGYTDYLVVGRSDSVEVIECRRTKRLLRAE